MKEKNRKIITIFNFYTINNSLKFKSRNENNCFIISKLNIMIVCMILCFLKFNNPKDNINISKKLKNKGFLNIKTIHKYIICSNKSK